MNIFHDASQRGRDSRPVCACLGVFDGLHLGHQRIIRHTLADARATDSQAVVITFDRHPATVVAPDHAPLLIYPLRKKLQLLDSLGVETTLLLRFNTRFSRQSGECFLRRLMRDFRCLSGFRVGRGFTFGHRQTGNLALLRQLGREHGWTVREVRSVLRQSQIISSTRIRDLIRQGEFASASALLGRPYSLTGIVRPGDRLGRQLGFPTANVQADGLVLPPVGVYAARVPLRNQCAAAVVNIGFRPTLRAASPSLRVEAHLLDYRGNLYGRDIEIVFAARIRAEQPFNSLAALRQQIHQDIQAARAALMRSMEPRSGVM